MPAHCCIKVLLLDHNNKIRDEKKGKDRCNRGLRRRRKRHTHRLLDSRLLSAANTMPGYVVSDMDECMEMLRCDYFTRCFSSLRARVRRCMPSRRAVSEMLKSVSTRTS